MQLKSGAVSCGGHSQTEQRTGERKPSQQYRAERAWTIAEKGHGFLGRLSPVRRQMSLRLTNLRHFTAVCQIALGELRSEVSRSRHAKLKDVQAARLESWAIHVR